MSPVSVFARDLDLLLNFAILAELADVNGNQEMSKRMHQRVAKERQELIEQYEIVFNLTFGKVGR